MGVSSSVSLPKVTMPEGRLAKFARVTGYVLLPLIIACFAAGIYLHSSPVELRVTSGANSFLLNGHALGMGAIACFVVGLALLLALILASNLQNLRQLLDFPKVTGRVTEMELCEGRTGEGTTWEAKLRCDYEFEGAKFNEAVSLLRTWGSRSAAEAYLQKQINAGQCELIVNPTCPSEAFLGPLNLAMGAPFLLILVLAMALAAVFVRVSIKEGAWKWVGVPNAEFRFSRHPQPTNHNR